MQAHAYFTAEEEEDALRNVLHYFDPHTKDVVMYKLEDNDRSFVSGKEIRITLNMGFLFSNRTKSVITEKGEIFVLSAKNTAFDTSFYQLDREKMCLKGRPSLPEGREDYSLAYMNKKIYLVGGRSRE